MDAVRSNPDITKFHFGDFNCDADYHGKYLGKVIMDSKSLTELEINACTFLHPKAFFEMCSPLLQAKNNLKVLKMKGILITLVEAKVIQFIMMKNKNIETMDFTECIDEDMTNFKVFI